MIDIPLRLFPLRNVLLCTEGRSFLAKWARLNLTVHSYGNAVPPREGSLHNPLSLCCQSVVSRRGYFFLVRIG